MADPHFTGYVYVITNLVTGKHYVGQTSGDPAKRWREHCQAAANQPKSVFHKTLRKYGADAFARRVMALPLCTQDLLDVTERQLIAAFDCRVPNGYNLQDGGSRGRQHPESIEKIRRSKRGVVTPSLLAAARANAASVKGRKQSPEERAMRRALWTPEYRARQSASHTGKRHSVETILKMSAAHVGKQPSEETKAKLQAAARGRKHTPETIARLTEINRKNAASRKASR